MTDENQKTQTNYGAADSVASLARFDGDLAVIARLLEKEGFRLSRGTWCGPDSSLPTVCIDRPDTPEWNGVWSAWDETDGEAETAFMLWPSALDAWEKDWSMARANQSND